MGGYLRMALPLQEMQQKGLTRLDRNTFEGNSNLFERLQGRDDLLGRRISLPSLGKDGQFRQMDLLQGLAAYPVYDQSLGGGRKVGPGLTNAEQAIPR